MELFTLSLRVWRRRGQEGGGEERDLHHHILSLCSVLPEAGKVKSWRWRAASRWLIAGGRRHEEEKRWGKKSRSLSSPGLGKEEGKEKGRRVSFLCKHKRLSQLLGL